MNLGIAFQIADDILDVTSDADQLGKAAGSDLLEGKLTLPLIYLLADDPSYHRAALTVMRDGTYASSPRATLIRAA